MIPSSYYLQCAALFLSLLTYSCVLVSVPNAVKLAPRPFANVAAPLAGTFLAAAPCRRYRVSTDARSPRPFVAFSIISRKQLDSAENVSGSEIKV